MTTLSARLAAALVARGYYLEVPAYQQPKGFQWQRIADDINARTGEPPIGWLAIKRIVLEGADPKVSTLVKICKGLDIPYSEALGE